MNIQSNSVTNASTKKILFIDPISGISGDMFLAACVDLGVDENALLTKLKSLGVDSFDITFSIVSKKGIRALSTKIKIAEQASNILTAVRHQHRHMRHIDEIIDSCHLSADVKKIARAIFLLIAEAEAKIHNTTIDKVHFHEVGAMDSIIDIIGAAICIDELGVDTIVCGHVPTGFGTVSCAHGTFPVPAPATLEILKGVPIRNVSIESELTTPTGAAIIKSVVSSYSPHLPDMKVTAIGYGAGNYDFEHPNVLRLVLGECMQTNTNALPLLNHSSNATSSSTGGSIDSIGSIDSKKLLASSSDNNLLWILEASIDDMQPEFYQYIIGRILYTGAKDAMILPAIMKKDRNGSILHVLADEPILPMLKELIFKETTTLGIRSWPVLRDALERKYDTVVVNDHEISIKIGILNNQVINVAPEYEDCKCVAIATGTPIKMIYQEALAKWKSTEI